MFSFCFKAIYDFPYWKLYCQRFKHRLNYLFFSVKTFVQHIPYPISCGNNVSKTISIIFHSYILWMKIHNVLCMYSLFLITKKIKIISVRNYTEFSRRHHSRCYTNDVLFPSYSYLKNAILFSIVKCFALTIAGICMFTCHRYWLLCQ